MNPSDPPDAPTTGGPTPAGPDPVSRADRRRARDRTGRSRRWWVGGALAGVVVVGTVVALVAAGGVSVATPPPAAPSSSPAGLVVLHHNMPSPYVLVDGSSDYLYTGGYGPGVAPHVPVRRFTTLNDITAAARTDAMPTLPAGSWGWIWTVDVHRAGPGYAMWFTTEYPAVRNPGGVANQCIGNATSSSPLGPFTPSAGPVICQQWGSIDPRVVVAPGGTSYLVWKSDTNADRTTVIPTTIWEQQLAPDGVTLVGTPRQIATSTQPWEGALAESPDMVDLGGTYYLFFSGNSSLDPRNGVGMMTCASIQGPCTDSRPTAFISSNRQGQGPGEESLFQQGGNTWLLYSPNAIFGPNLYRPLAVARVAVGPHGPYVARFDGAVPGR